VNANLPGLFGKAIQGAEFNLSQSNWLWYLRECPPFKNIFTALHGTTDLCTSFDGFSLDWSCENKSEPWLHEDKHLYLAGAEKRSVQGVYSATETTETSRGFACVPASHLRAKERFAARPKGGSRHYVVLEAESPDQTEAVKILSPANSFLLFDSSVLHMNDPSREDCEGWNRRAAYICMMPKSWRTKKVYEEKVRAYVRGEGTSHWAMFCDVKLKPRWPRKRHSLNALNDVKVTFHCTCETAAHTEMCIPVERRELF
jgi:hypothetical protein